jgi:barstar (barnase inhibitor)
VAVFDRDADLRRLDYQLMANTFVTLFWRLSLFDEAVGWMADHGYTIVRLDARRWFTEADMHRDVASALDFPDYYGHNLDALNDCLRDVVDYRYGTTEEATGLLLAFTGYHAFAQAHRRCAGDVLDIIAIRSRSAALIGHRMLCLAQSDDPQIAFEPVGATPVMWNHAEWLDARRRPDSDPHPLIA